MQKQQTNFVFNHRMFVGVANYWNKLMWWLLSDVVHREIAYTCSLLHHFYYHLRTNSFKYPYLDSSSMVSRYFLILQESCGSLPFSLSLHHYFYHHLRTHSFKSPYLDASNMVLKYFIILPESCGSLPSSLHHNASFSSFRPALKNHLVKLKKDLSITFRWICMHVSEDICVCFSLWCKLLMVLVMCSVA